MMHVEMKPSRHRHFSCMNHSQCSIDILWLQGIAAIERDLSPLADPLLQRRSDLMSYRGSKNFRCQGMDLSAIKRSMRSRKWSFEPLMKMNAKVSRGVKENSGKVAGNLLNQNR